MKTSVIIEKISSRLENNYFVTVFCILSERNFKVIASIIETSLYINKPKILVANCPKTWGKKFNK